LTVVFEVGDFSQDLLVAVSTEVDSLTEVLVDGSVETLKVGFRLQLCSLVIENSFALQVLSLLKILPCEPYKWIAEMKVHCKLCVITLVEINRVRREK
jgi:hypothetical protein